MSIYSKPIAFAVLSAIVILIGTMVTTIVPIFMPSTQPSGDYVKPYTAIEIEGRDIYIREGCNNCHTQTVRALRTEVARYGDYSKPEEFYYDRPHLWGSRRTGPDLQRVGGKYPDAWHYQHTVAPQSMFDMSNMPPYKWLATSKLDTGYTLKKAQVLGYKYNGQAPTPALISSQLQDAKANAMKSSAMRDKYVPANLRGELTELDALVAYLQKIGRDFKDSVKPASASASVSGIANPFKADPKAVEEGKAIYDQNCSACHGADLKGGIGNDLTSKALEFGASDAELYASISKGLSGGMPNWDNVLGDEKIWKVISFIRSARGE